MPGVCNIPGGVGKSGCLTPDPGKPPKLADPIKIRQYVSCLYMHSRRYGLHYFNFTLVHELPCRSANALTIGFCCCSSFALSNSNISNEDDGNPPDKEDISE